MLDQLIESRSTAGENARRGGFLLTTAIILVALLLGAWMYSLFAHDFGMGGGDLELSSLVAPVPVPEEAPPPPEPEKQPEKQQTADKTPVDMPTRQVNMARVDEPIAPDKISTTQNTQKARPNSAFVISNKDTDVSGNTGPVRDTASSGTGVVAQKPTVVEDKGDEPPPPPPAPKPTPPPVPKKVSLGVINGKATRLVTPPYPAAAKAVHASGAVNVQVSIDTAGNVVSASAVSGHPLLRAAAEQAARSSKFSPTVLSGQPVSVTGVIVYNFVAQ